MIKAGITHDLAPVDLKLDLTGPAGDKLVIEIKQDYNRQLSEGIQPPLKEASTKRPRRSRKPWDTIAKRLWYSLTGYTSDSIVEKRRTGVTVGSKVPYYIYQIRMGRDVGVTEQGSNNIVNIIGDIIFAKLVGKTRGLNK